MLMSWNQCSSSKPAKQYPVFWEVWGPFLNHEASPSFSFWIAKIWAGPVHWKSIFMHFHSIPPSTVTDSGRLDGTSEGPLIQALLRMSPTISLPFYFLWQSGLNSSFVYINFLIANTLFIKRLAKDYLWTENGLAPAVVITKTAGNSGNWHSCPQMSLDSLYTVTVAYMRGVRKKTVRTQGWWGGKTNSNTQLVLSS